VLKYKEAFCLVIYQCQTYNHVEIVWNSRDGIVPDFIKCKICNNKSKHVCFDSDVKVYNLDPGCNLRIFVTATPDLLNNINNFDYAFQDNEYTLLVNSKQYRSIK